MALQPDGRIVVAGTTTGDFGLARYEVDGSLDPTFGLGGKVITDLGFADDAFEVAIQTDGRIVAAEERRRLRARSLQPRRQPRRRLR